MKIVVDTSVLIDHLREHPGATALVLDALSRSDELWSSYIVRTEILAGMRSGEERITYALMEELHWAEVDHAQSEIAGELGRRFGRSRPGIQAADLIVAALATQLGAELFTRNLKHFPMFPGLRAPY